MYCLTYVLYAPFMSKLSACIFNWDLEYLDILKSAKRAQMKEDVVLIFSESGVMKGSIINELLVYYQYIIHMF